MSLDQPRTTRSTSKALDDGGASSPDTPLFYSLLVHNLSHSDLMLGVRSFVEAKSPVVTAAAASSSSSSRTRSASPRRPSVTSSSAATAAAAASAAVADDDRTSSSSIVPPLPPSFIARPRFSRFKQMSGRLLTFIENAKGIRGIEFPSPHNARVTGSPTCPYGFRVDPPLKFQDWDSFKLKEEDAEQRSRMAKPEVIAAYFPLLAVLIPRWLSIVSGKNARRGITHDAHNKKLLYLISGAGTPWNDAHDTSGNTTNGVAKLAAWFIGQIYPDIEVHIISGAEIFHMDTNVQFVNKELKPRIEEVRRILAGKYFEKWPKYMHLAITLTDGASARISAINASLRHFKPDQLHCWQLKSFWHEYPYITGARGESDVEFHEFEKLEMTPPTLVSETDSWTKLLVKEMIAHKEEFERVRDNQEKYNELDKFWLRKSKQPVLSVLMVKKKNKGFKFFRGINVEVSMPTGSLCSERNAIGSALSSDPSLCRKDLRMIAVLALGLEPHSTTSTINANLPIPKELIPVGYTPPAAAANGSPVKHGDYTDAASHVAAASASSHLNGIDITMMDVDLPQAKPNMQKQPSERSMLSRTNSTASHYAATSVLLPPTSPSLKGKQHSSSLSVPPSPVHKSQPHSHMDDTDTNVSRTPRKRKASSGVTSPANVPLPATAAPSGSPKFVRGGSTSSSASNAQSPKSAARELLNIPKVEHSPPPPLLHPVSTSPRIQTRALLQSAAASSSSSSVALVGSVFSVPAMPEARTSKRVKRANSGSIDAAQAQALQQQDGLNASQVAYVQHEIDLIKHRDATMPPHLTPQMSGNSAPNSLTPIDRCISEDPHHHSNQKQITDERNPINPCGSCNEWLKKIAEVNPDFKVVTFTATDCTTCFVKSVKF